MADSVVDQGLTPEECTYHPRWHDQLSGITYFEVSIRDKKFSFVLPIFVLMALL